MKQIKRWISYLLVFCLIISVMPVTALAASSGSCGDNLTWTLGEGSQATLTISGTGHMNNYLGLYFGSGNHAPWWSTSNSPITRVEIEDGVTSIGSAAFARCYQLRYIEIPNSIVSIGEGCFEDCSALYEITIPEGVTSIARGTFFYCTFLRNVNIPDSVTSIESSAFYNCTNLINITLPQKLESIADQAFAHCEYLDTVSIPSTVRSIAPKAFVFCKNLKSISVDESNSVYSNDDLGVLYDKTKSSLIRVPEGLDTVFSFANSITEIGECAFYNCDNLESIAIPEGISIIKEETFYSCSALASVTLPASVKRISSDAFQSCDNLTDVYYGGSETEWNELAIYSGNDNLKNATIHFNSTGPSTDDGEGSTSDSSITTQVCFFREWDAENQIAYFDNDVLLGSQVTEETDTSFLEDVDNLVGHYVLAETKARNDNDVAPNTLISIEPVDTKTGTVTAADEETITIDGVTYPNGITNIVESADGNGQVDLFDPAAYVDKFVLYHIYEGKLVGIEALVTEEGSLISWNAETKEITIDPDGSDVGETTFKLSDLADEETLNTLNEIVNPYTTVKYVKDNNNIVYEVTVVTTPDGGESSDEFNEFIYRADHLINNDFRNLEDYIDSFVDSSPSQMILDLEAEGLDDVMAIWNSITTALDSVTEIEKLPELHFEQQDVYSAIILGALGIEVTQGINDRMEESIYHDVDTITKVIADIMQAKHNIDIMDVATFQGMSIKQKEDMVDALKEAFEGKKYASEAISNTFKYIDQFIDVSDFCGDYVQNVLIFANLQEVSLSMRTVLEEMYNQAPADDPDYLYLRMALQDCIQAIDAGSADFYQKYIDGLVDAAGEFGLTKCTGILWDNVVASAAEACPAIAILIGGYTAGRTISEEFTNIDEFSEQYYKTYAVDKYQATMIRTIYSLLARYQDMQTEENATALLDSINLMFGISDVDCNTVYEMIDALDSAMWGQLKNLIGVEGIDEAKEAVKGIHGHYTSDHKNFYINWIWYLEEDYPEIFSLYKDRLNLNEPLIVPIRSYSIECPVNVSVYDNNDTLIAYIRDGSAYATDKVAVIRNGEDKEVYFYDDADYRIVCDGYGYGTMDIVITEYDGQSAIRQAAFYDLAVSENNSYEMWTKEDPSDDTIYSVTTDGKSIPADYDSRVTAVTSDLQHVVINCGYFDTENGPMFEVDAYPGERLDINAYIPEGYQFVGWHIDVDDGCFGDASNEKTTIRVPEQSAVITAIIEEIPVEHIHSYNEPVFVWSDDNTCTATFTCIDGDDTQTVACTVTSETTPATETEAGATAYTATAKFNGQTYTDTKTVEIPATGHVTHITTLVPAVEATCEHTGNIAYYTCSGCDLWFEDAEATKVIEDHNSVITPLADHSYQSAVTAPTCTEQGYTTHTCSVCGDSYVDTYIDAIGHSFGEWIETKTATCTEKGEESRSCACGETETRETDALGHTAADAAKENEIAASCGTDGSYDSVVYCATCGNELSRETVTVPATGDHNYAAEQERVEATCTEDGYVIMACGCGATEKTVLPAIGHDYESVATAPTCTEQGYTTHTCSNCGDSYVDSYVDATGHSFGEWTETKAATCTEKGEETRICACGETETREIKALGHTYQDGICNRCGEYDPDYEFPTEPSEPDEPGRPCWDSFWDWIFGGWWGDEKCDHEYTSVITAPTCDQKGYTTHTCDKCGDSYTDSYTNALGHQFENGVCTKCGKTEKPGGPGCGSIWDWIFGWWN